MGIVPQNSSSAPSLPPLTRARCARLRPAPIVVIYRAAPHPALCRQTSILPRPSRRCYDPRAAVRGRRSNVKGPRVVGQMKILAGNSNGQIAESIAAYLGVPLTGCHVRRFADLEILYLGSLRLFKILLETV